MDLRARGAAPAKCGILILKYIYKLFPLVKKIEKLYISFCRRVSEKLCVL